jgi:ABC-type nitrate/sulfonate/bicarbonate transport system substrate-binding protein
MGVCAVRKWQLKAATLTVAVALLLASPAMALEKLVGGIAGQNSPTTWPYSIAMAKGMLAKRGMEFDIVYGQSASSILQQLVGGSVDLVVSTGINEPMHAAAKGAAVGILRIVGKVPPYAIDAQKNIHSLKELKGKTIAIGGRTDITRLYYDRMLEPNGVHWGDYDAIVIGSTTGRLAALKSGAVAATMLLPPFSFRAEAEGYNNIGLAVDYAADLPFTASVLSVPWAQKHPDLARGINESFDEGLTWLDDPANKEEAIAVLVKSGLPEGEVRQSYDFLRKIDFWAHDAKVSRGMLQKIIDSMRKIGDYDEAVDVNKLVIPNVTLVVD